MNNHDQLIQILSQVYTQSPNVSSQQRKQMEQWLQKQFAGQTRWQHGIQFLQQPQELLQWFGLQLIEQQLLDNSWQQVALANREQVKNFLFDHLTQKVSFFW